MKCFKKGILSLVAALLLITSAFSTAAVAYSAEAVPARSADSSELFRQLSYGEENLAPYYGEPQNHAVSVGGSRELSYFKPIKDKSVYSYGKVSVSLGNERLSDVAYLINDTTYLPLRAAMTLAGAKVAFDSSTRTATATTDTLNLIVADGSYVVYANERPLLSNTPAVILSDGKMYIPIRTLAKALGLSVEWLPPASVRLTGEIKALTHAQHYYNADQLYWLSRIISAESRGESLLGQIAVGNIVLNRVRSKDYPNTIYGVIFDRKYGVQFSPVKDGSIYRTPTYSSVQAAKICLEGVSVSEKILFFLNPSASTSSWIVQNRRYAFTIGNHYFFY